MAREYRVFISHSWQYSGALEALRNILNARGYFNATYEESTRDSPINSQNELYIKQRLSQKIDSADVILALAGIYASHSSWMVWELDRAIKLGVPIIGVIPRGQERVSSVVSTRSLVNVRWSTESIVSAIRQYARNS